jgi:hypothetical protein
VCHAFVDKFVHFEAKDLNITTPVSKLVVTEHKSNDSDYC